MESVTVSKSFLMAAKNDNHSASVYCNSGVKKRLTGCNSETRPLKP